MTRPSHRGPGSAAAPRRRGPKPAETGAPARADAQAAPREDGKPWRELTLDIWQFVRVMVELEERDRGPGCTLLADWRKPWREVDRRLTKLGRDDPTGFSDLMMNHQVRLTLRARAQLQELVGAIDGVVAKLERGLEAPSLDGQQAEGMTFERRSLKSLRGSLLKGRG